MQCMTRDELEVSNKDAVLLGALALQATRGDYDESIHTPQYLVGHNWLSIPPANMLGTTLPVDQPNAKYVCLVFSGVLLLSSLPMEK
jgi:hypothetical protein